MDDDPEPTPGQLRALLAIARCGTLESAAIELGVTRHTMVGHVRGLRAKTGLHYLPQLVKWGADHQWWGADRSEGGSA